MVEPILRSTVAEGPSATVRYGPSMEKCLKKYQKAGTIQRIKKQLNRFIDHKVASPADPFGSNDKLAAPLYAGFYKAHLTHDDSVMYRYDRRENVIRIYGVWSHDELGLGNPGSRAAASAMAATLDSQVFESKPKSF